MKFSASLGAFTALIVALLTSCDSNNLSNPSVDALLDAAKVAEREEKYGDAELKLLDAVTLSDDAKGVPQIKALNALSQFYFKQNKPEKCQSLYLRAKQIGAELIESEKTLESNVVFLTEYSKAICGLANCERDLGHFTTALRLYDQAKTTSGRVVDSSLKDAIETNRQLCLAALKEQEDAEGKLLSDRKSDRHTGKDRDAFVKRYRELMSGYASRAPDLTVRDLALLAQDAKQRWGYEEPLYSMLLNALTEIAERTGQFATIDGFLTADFESMSAIDRVTRSSQRVSASDVVELGGFIEVLLRQGRVSIGKGEWQEARKKLERAFMLTREHYPDDPAKLETSFRLLSQVEQFEGNYSIAYNLNQAALAMLKKKHPQSIHVMLHARDSGINCTLDGRLPQAVEVAEWLAQQRKHEEAEWGMFQLAAFAVLFKVETSIGNLGGMRRVQNLMDAVVKTRKRIEGNWVPQRVVQEGQILLVAKKFEELLGYVENHQVDPEHDRRLWLSNCDLMAYAAGMAGKNEKAARYADIVESSRQDNFTGTLVLSRVMKVSLAARSAPNAEFDRAFKCLTKSFDSSGHPAKLAYVQPLTNLASDLIKCGKSKEAEILYSCALRTYDRVPGRVDEPLLNVLRDLGALLEKHQRHYEAAQIQSKLAQKTRKFKTVRDVTIGCIRKSRLM